MRAIAIIVALLAACDPVDEVKGGLDDVGSLLEPLCIGFDCGQVFQCTMVGRDGVEETAEYCWKDDDGTALESAIDNVTVWAAHCVPSSRGGSFGMPCLYSCPPPSHGCNAFNSCWCG